MLSGSNQKPKPSHGCCFDCQNTFIVMNYPCALQTCCFTLDLLSVARKSLRKKKLIFFHIKLNAAIFVTVNNDASMLAVSNPATPQEEQDLGVVEVKFRKNSYSPETFLHFIFPSNYFTIRLKLKNTPNAIQLPRVHLEVAQGNDVKFKPGTDVKLDFKFKIEGDMEDIDREEETSQILVKSDTEDDVVDRHFARFVKLEGSKGDRHGTLLLNSTFGGKEGILEFRVNVKLNCSRNCLVYEFDVHRSVRFYREDHTGPFPEGFVGFVQDDYNRGRSKVYCSINTERECFFFCEVYGDHPKYVQIFKDDEPTDDVRLSASFTASTQLYFDDVSFADAGTYTCKAWSKTNETITQTMSLVVVDAAKINRELSTITQFDNGVRSKRVCFKLSRFGCDVT